MKRTITVSIPVYNGEMYIIEALDSVLNQSRKVDQIIICDNKSTDNTIKLVKNYIRSHENHNFYLFEGKTNIGFQKNLYSALFCVSVTRPMHLLNW